MPDKNLKIIVEGKPGSGKSTLMEAIHNVLSAHGMNVEITHDDYEINRSLARVDLIKKLDMLKNRHTLVSIVERNS